MVLKQIIQNQSKTNADLLIIMFKNICMFNPNSNPYNFSVTFFSHDKINSFVYVKCSQYIRNSTAKEFSTK